ncbi:MAG: D-glycero-beta-D-manno-heptose 1,7-bisphosphate 7-phosphatase [Gammaproteobacteria bacterium]|jgi:D-glycero-D-manno-heptose 1,7-bisphosphate phosphatase
MSSPRRRLVVLDRDGVINVDVPGRYVCSAEQWHPIAGALEAMARLSDAGFAIYVVSNQSGIGRGLFTESALAAMHAKFLHELGRHGGTIAGWHYCPHTPDEGCRCRKPATGLLEDVSRAAGVPLAGVPFIGDKWSDLVAGRHLHMRAILVATGHGRTTLLAHPGDVSEFFADLSTAANALIGGAVAQVE